MFGEFGGFGGFGGFVWFEVVPKKTQFCGVRRNEISWTGKGRNKLRKLPNSPPNHQADLARQGFGGVAFASVLGSGSM
jgi:hypothetical protein